MRNIKIAPDEYYHLFNRGANKQVTFNDKNDYIRFLFLVLYFQSPVVFKNVGREVKAFTPLVQYSVLHKEAEVLIKEVVEKRSVELIQFCLMPNHFHLIVKEIEEGGISSYMQRVLNSYSKYFNKKYNRSGHLFQGPYKAVHVESNKQLTYLSAYVHKNPRELSGWSNKENKYPWSSYQDFVSKNRFGELLVSEIILDQFKNKYEYVDFVKTSMAKEVEGELGGSI